MITIHWTTHDLDDYYAQLKQIPRLSDEERHHLLTTLAQSQQVRDTSSPDILQAARHRLIEGHLNLATYIAVQECPPSRYRLLPDLVGAVNLELVEAMRRCNLNDTHDLTSYLAANVRGTIKRVIGDESLIHTPSSTRSVARAKGTVDRLYAFETVSFDVAMHPFDDDLREPLTSPLLPTEAASPRDPALRAQAEEWLALLTPRAQAVLRLRYGLSDDNEHAHTTAEIAHLLGIRRQAVQQAEREALQRLRALMAGEASVSTMAGKPRIRRGKPQQERVASAHHRTYCTLTPACFIHGKQGCLRLRRKFVCFPTVEDAKNLIKRFRAEGYTSSDSMERYLPEWEYVCLNWREQQGTPTSSRSMQRVS